MSTTNRLSNTKKNIGNNIKGITLDGAVVWDPKDLEKAVKAVVKSGWGQSRKPKKTYKVVEYYGSFTQCPRCKYQHAVWKNMEVY